MRRFLVFLLIGLAVAAHSQSELFGDKSYTSQRSLSVLSGGGFAVDPEGRVVWRGATAYSTPIAYTVGPRQWVGVGGVLSSTRSPRFINVGNPGDITRSANSTAGIMTSFGSKLGVLCIGAMLTTSEWDTSVNLQWSPPGQVGKVRYAVGVQDVFGDAAENNGVESVLQHGYGNSASPFAVSTVDLGHGAYASIGVGDRRFKGIWGNMTIPVGPAQGFLEFDAFNWNFGLTGALYHRQNWEESSRQSVWASAGFVRGKYFYWTLGFAF